MTNNFDNEQIFTVVTQSKRDTFFPELTRLTYFIPATCQAEANKIVATVYLSPDEEIIS